MKILILLLFSFSAWSQSPREMALDQFPAEVRPLINKTVREARTALKHVPANRRREDERGLFFNLLGVNYDVTLGRVGEQITWMALQAPSDKARGLYSRLMENDPAVKEVDVGGATPGKYIELSFVRDAVTFRFKEHTHQLHSVVVRDLPSSTR